MMSFTMISELDIALLVALGRKVTKEWEDIYPALAMCVCDLYVTDWCNSKSYVNPIDKYLTDY